MHLIWVAVRILDRLQLRLCRLSLCRNRRLSLLSPILLEDLCTQRSDGDGLKLSRLSHCRNRRLSLVYILKNTF